MLPTWILVLVAFGGIFAVNAAVKIFKGHEIYIGGQKTSRGVTGGALAIILIAFVIMAAIQLGFIPDHAP